MMAVVEIGAVARAGAPNASGRRWPIPWCGRAALKIAEILVEHSLQMSLALHDHVVDGDAARRRVAADRLRPG
jgi:hypothetical protein